MQKNQTLCTSLSRFGMACGCRAQSLSTPPLPANPPKFLLRSSATAHETSTVSPDLVFSIYFFIFLHRLPVKSVKERVGKKKKKKDRKNHTSSGDLSSDGRACEPRYLGLALATTPPPLFLRAPHTHARRFFTCQVFRQHLGFRSVNLISTNPRHKDFRFCVGAPPSGWPWAMWVVRGPKRWIGNKDAGLGIAPRSCASSGALFAVRFLAPDAAANGRPGPSQSLFPVHLFGLRALQESALGYLDRHSTLRACKPRPTRLRPGWCGA
jgi:hypothetical protein